MRFLGVEEWVRALQGALVEELAEGMERAGEMVAAEARQNHDYENRTGTLEERTMVGGPVVTTTNHVTVTVVGDTPYGKWIEEGTDHIRPRRFLASAYDRRVSGVVAELDVALHRAGEKVSR